MLLNHIEIWCKPVDPFRNHLKFTAPSVGAKSLQSFVARSTTTAHASPTSQPATEAQHWRCSSTFHVCASPTCASLEATGSQPDECTAPLSQLTAPDIRRLGSLAPQTSGRQRPQSRSSGQPVVRSVVVLVCVIGLVNKGIAVIAPRIIISVLAIKYASNMKSAECDRARRRR